MTESKQDAYLRREQRCSVHALDLAGSLATLLLGLDHGLALERQRTPTVLRGVAVVAAVHAERLQCAVLMCALFVAFGLLRLHALLL